LIAKYAHFWATDKDMMADFIMTTNNNQPVTKW